MFTRNLYVNWVNNETGETGRDKCGSVLHPYYALSPEDYGMRLRSILDDIMVGIDIGARSLWRTMKTRQEDRITGTIIPRKDTTDNGREYREAIRRINGGKY